MQLSCSTIIVNCSALLHWKQHISLRCQPIFHIAQQRKWHWGVLKTSSPLPHLHQAWQHHPTAGGDEAQLGWWQKSDKRKKRRKVKFRTWQYDKPQVFLSYVQRMESTLTSFTEQIHTYSQHLLLTPPLCVSDWLGVKAIGFLCTGGRWFIICVIWCNLRSLPYLTCFLALYSA